MTTYSWFRGIAASLVLCYASACQNDDEPSIDWTQEEYYSPATDDTPGDSLVIRLGDASFERRDEEIEELADRLGLTKLDTTAFSFHLYSAEVDEEGQIVSYLPGLVSTSLSDNIDQWVYQSGRYVFRFQESEAHRFVSIVEKQGERRLVGSRGQELVIARQATARLYVEEESIIDQLVGIKRDRITLSEEIEDLAAEYPQLVLPESTFAATNYLYDTVLADSLDDGIVNERRVQVLMAVYEDE